jgi:hypothetical protein
MTRTTVDQAGGVRMHPLPLYLRRPRGRPEGGALTNRDECTCEPQARVHEERVL